MAAHSTHQDAAPLSERAITGAYAELEALLALRLRSANATPRQTRRRNPNSGQRLSRLRGRGVDFAEVRAYQPGDDVRSIDWRVTARKNEPHTKVFREERERPTLICVDQTRSMFFGSRLRLKSVAAAELAARAAWQALANGDRVGGLIIGNDTSTLAKPKRSSRAVARMLGDLSKANASLSRHSSNTSADYLARELTHLRRLAQTNHRIVVLTDFQPAGAYWVDTLRGLARHNDVIAVHIVDPMEQQLPIAEQFMVSDGSSRVPVDGADAGLRNRYQQRFAAQQRKLQQTLTQSAVRYLQVSTDSNLDRLDLWR
ncbi:MAG: DUF58 domain-containing protein [Pseudomonadales bacterium]